MPLDTIAHVIMSSNITPKQFKLTGAQEMKKTRCKAIEKPVSDFYLTEVEKAQPQCSLLYGILAFYPSLDSWILIY